MAEAACQAHHSPGSPPKPLRPGRYGRCAGRAGAPAARVALRQWAVPRKVTHEAVAGNPAGSQVHLGAHEAPYSKETCPGQQQLSPAQFPRVAATRPWGGTPARLRNGLRESGTLADPVDTPRHLPGPTGLAPSARVRHCRRCPLPGRPPVARPTSSRCQRLVRSDWRWSSGCSPAPSPHQAPRTWAWKIGPEPSQGQQWEKKGRQRRLPRLF